MKRAWICVFLWLAAAAWAAEAKAPVFLPSAFGGWRMSGSARVSQDAAVADPAFAAVMKEYGFQELETAVYTRPDRKLTIKAARFRDASGAYGAFTFYKTEGMQTEKIGDLGASANTKVLFYRGDILVQADLDRVTAMSAAELRELAATLPAPGGTESKLPTVPAYLPKQAYVAHSAKYVVGPAGLANIDAPIAADLVDFTRGAELALGRYNSSRGPATLVVIAYPTPQIAGERLRAIEAAHNIPNPQGQNSAVAASPTQDFFIKRTGPMLAMMVGAIPADEARSLLGSINYDADVTWNEATSLSKKDNIGNLIIAACLLAGILMAIALVSGLAFSGVRLLLRRVFPNSVFNRREDADIIRLNLRQ